MRRRKSLKKKWLKWKTDKLKAHKEKKEKNFMASTVDKKRKKQKE